MRQQGSTAYDQVANCVANTRFGFFGLLVWFLIGIHQVLHGRWSLCRFADDKSPVSGAFLRLGMVLSVLSAPFRGTGCGVRHFLEGSYREDRTMKPAIAFIAAAGLALAVPASADDAHIGVGVGPVGAGVTVGSDHRDHYGDRDTHTTIIKREEPREHTTIIKKEHEEPREKTIIHERDY